MRQLYINGSVATVDSKMSYVQAFAVEDGKFIKTGTNEEILALKTEDATVVDLDGKTVMPGFNLITFPQRTSILKQIICPNQIKLEIFSSNTLLSF